MPLPDVAPPIASIPCPVAPPVAFSPSPVPFPLALIPEPLPPVLDATSASPLLFTMFNCFSDSVPVPGTLTVSLAVPFFLFRLSLPKEKRFDGLAQATVGAIS